MKLKSFGISNFKAFGKEFQTIPIKPITLVFGPNSSGKSSLLHSLLWLNHAESRGETDVFNPSLAGKSVNLGGFDSCLNRKSGMHRLRFAITIENPSPNPDTPQWHDAISQFKLVFACARSEKDQPPELIACDLFADDVKLVTVRKSKSSVLQGRFNFDFEWNHPALPFASALTEDDMSILGMWSKWCLPYEIASLSFLPTKVFPPKEDKEAAEAMIEVPKEFRRFAMQDLPVSVENLLAAFRRSIQEIIYIPPIRVIPDCAMDLQSCELSGWRWIAKHPEICDRINNTLNNLGIDHQVKIRSLIPADTVKESIIRTLSQAEAGRDWGGLSGAVENAMETWKAFDYSEYKQWLERHPALSKEMEDYWYAIVRDEYCYHSAYFEEYPEADKEESVPSWWIKEEAKRQALYLLDEWGSNSAAFGGEAARLFISEDQGVRDAILNALKERGLDKDLLPGDGHLQLRLHDPKRDVWVALQDVGVGTSQVLPIILEAYAQHNKLIAIEQPELHLHPALQAELGDVFIESALGENKNTFLLETHSEHLILRILRRIRESTEKDFSDWSDELKKACPNGIRPEDVAVLYVQPGEDGAEVTELPVTPDGDFARPWPGGFFAERSKELF